ncbi:MAG: triose-phosphate isomerase [Hymenobacter sp.]
MESGAYTGEVSAKQAAFGGLRLRDSGPLGAPPALPRRRSICWPTSCKTALAAGLQVIFCVGESLETREADETFDFIGPAAGRRPVWPERCGDWSRS